MKVYVLVTEHDYRDNMRAFSTREKALEALNKDYQATVALYEECSNEKNTYEIEWSGDDYVEMKWSDFLWVSDRMFIEELEVE